MSYKISDIPTHNSAPSTNRKIELESPTGPTSEWATLAEMLAAIDCPVVVNKNGAGIPASPTGSLVRIVGANATQAFIVFDAYGNNGGLLFERWGGTLGSETALATNENIGVLLARGYDGSVLTGNRFSMQIRASGSWSTSNHGTYLVLNTTTQGTVVGAVERMRIDGVGSVEIGGATDAAASAILDVVSTTKGALVAPRMTEAQRDAISSPATGLEVFVTGANAKSVYDGSGWASAGGLRRVTTQFDKTNDGTLASVPGLSVAVAAGKTYTFRAVLHMTQALTAGVQVAIGGTATATSIVYEALVLGNGSSVGITKAGRGTALGAGVGQHSDLSNSSYYATIEGLITVNAAGTLTVQFCQDAAVAATTSSVLVGSTFEVKEVA